MLFGRDGRITPLGSGAAPKCRTYLLPQSSVIALRVEHSNNESEIERMSIVTFNVRGLRNRIKRRSIFRHIRINYQHSIIILQETHSLSNMEYSWRCEWSGQIFFAHGSESGQGGVAMLFPVNFPCTPCKLYGDENGRVICAKVETRAERDAIFIMGVYGPSIDNQNDKCKFLDQVRELMACYETNNMCLAGDFNIKLSKLDSDNSTYHCTRASRKLQDILTEFSLEDAWRYQHPAVRRYTWRRSNPKQQSRIDYFLTSINLLTNNVTETRIDTGILSDHNFVVIDIQISNERRGPGTWRYNNSLLNDISHVNTVRAEIANANNNREVYSGVISKGVKIEMLLSNIRVLTTQRSKRLARELRREENQLYNRANELEHIVADKPTNAQLSEYERVKKVLDNFKEKRGRIAILHSQAGWLEDGEKSTKYFLRLCKTKTHKNRSLLCKQMMSKLLEAINRY